MRGSSKNLISRVLNVGKARVKILTDNPEQLNKLVTRKNVREYAGKYFKITLIRNTSRHKVVKPRHAPKTVALVRKARTLLKLHRSVLTSGEHRRIYILIKNRTILSKKAVLAEINKTAK